MRCKAIGRDFDRGCGFLQDTYNDAAFNTALPLQKRLRNFSLHVMNIVWTRSALCVQDLISAMLYAFLRL